MRSNTKQHHFQGCEVGRAKYWGTCPGCTEQLHIDFCESQDKICSLQTELKAVKAELKEERGHW